jgi:hypothetical protein
MIDVADPSEAFTAGDYSRQARAALAGHHRRGKLPIVTGGTGLYLRALIDGLFPAPPRSEEFAAPSQRRSRKGARLAASHPHSPRPRSGHANPSQRHAQARPRHRSLPHRRQPMTQAWQAGRDALQGYRVLRIGLNPDRKALYARINQRAAAMFENGLVEETRQLAEKIRRRCPAPHLTRLSPGAAHVARRDDVRASNRQRSARTSQLRQTPDDLVSPRTRSPLAQGFGDEEEFEKKRRAIIASTLDQLLPNANSQALHLAVKMAPLQAKRLSGAAYISVAVVDLLQNVIPLIRLTA